MRFAFECVSHRPEATRHYNLVSVTKHSPRRRKRLCGTRPGAAVEIASSYCLNGHMLTEEQIQFYDDNGTSCPTHYAAQLGRFVLCLINHLE